MQLTIVKQRATLLLDRPGTRWLLAKAATCWARSLTGDNQLSVRYDGMWIDVVGQMCLPRPRPARFSYRRFDFERMREFNQERLAGSVDYWTYVYRPREGDVIIDIGAGIGVDAFALSPLVGNTGSIHCLEAHPRTFQALLKTCEMNGLRNVLPHHLAVSDRSETIYISDLDNDEENTVSKIQGAEHSIATMAVTIDEFIVSQKIHRVGLLKMNIEGAEQLAILGLDKCIDRVDHVAIACHDFRGFYTREPVIAYLRTRGFDIVDRTEDPRLYVRDHVHGIRRI
jgi:FkbM family methyltransferase